ncbi:MAG: MqnA/MqnD/SBP family protein [Planctomycetota bacterium]
MTVAIGGVPYGVGAPLLAGLAEEPGCTLVQRPPTELIELLRQGRLDAALVSSVEAIERPGYSVVPGLGIACKREVRSVRAFRRRGAPVRRVGLDRSSATSAALLRVLLRGPRRRDTDPATGGPTFETIAPVRAPADLPHDLVLLIGDLGLGADPGDREVWDLGREWVAFTGLPFVFAVWLLRPGADAEAITPLLRRARARGARLGAVDGTHGAVHYDLDDDDLRGLARFWAEARAAGFGAADAEPTFCTSTLEGT